MLRRLVAHPLAGGHGPGMEGFDNALVPPGDAQVNQADGVAPVVGIGAGHAGDRQAEVRPGQAVDERAMSQPRACLAPRAMASATWGETAP